MTKVAEIVNRAASLILVRAAEQPLSGNEAETFIEILNDMITEWSAAGLPMGFTKVADLGEDVTVPDSALRAIKYNLAICAAPEFGKDASQGVRAIAETSYRNLERQLVRPPYSDFPDTLPIGTGNSCTLERPFYPPPEDGLLDEIDGSIILEENTGD